MSWVDRRGSFCSDGSTGGMSVRISAFGKGFKLRKLKRSHHIGNDNKD